MKARWILVPAIGLAMVAGTAFADMELAKKSGCTACHKIEAKVVGPPWACVAKRYKGQEGEMKAKLVEKIKKGGKGAWTEGEWAYLKNAVPMPPYSPRVPDADIEKMVDFVLGLDPAQCPPKS